MLIKRFPVLLFAGLLPFLLMSSCKDTKTKSEIVKTAVKRPTGIKRPTTPPLPHMDTPAQNDIEERQIFFAEIGNDLKNEKYDELESIESDITKTKARFPGGDWKLVRFLEALQEPEREKESTEVQWEYYLSKLRKWNTMNPRSCAAKVYLASGLISYAWKARGPDYASTVTKEGWSSFSKRLDEAEKILVETENDCKTSINWYTAMQSIALGKGWTRGQSDHLLQEAVQVEPKYWDFYVNHAYYLLPRWYGSPGEWEKFTEESASKFSADEGDVFYSVICWQISRFYESGTYFKETKVDWKRIKNGFVLRAKLYGPSYRYLNAFCFMAGDMLEISTAKTLFKLIGDNWEPDFWSDKKGFEDYRAWVMNTKHPRE